MDRILNELEEQIRNRPTPAPSPAFREATLKRMRTASAPRAWSWVEWSLTAAAVWILWGGMLMMQSPSSIAAPTPTPEEEMALVEALDEVLPEMDEHEQKRLLLLNRLQG